MDHRSVVGMAGGIFACLDAFEQVGELVHSDAQVLHPPTQIVSLRNRYNSLQTAPNNDETTHTYKSHYLFIDG